MRRNGGSATDEEVVIGRSGERGKETENWIRARQDCFCGTLIGISAMAVAWRVGDLIGQLSYSSWILAVNRMGWVERTRNHVQLLSPESSWM
jgi:hypothetical protein